MMKKVFISSPLYAPTAPAIAIHRLYATKCVFDSIKRGEAPFAPHLFLTIPTLLDDSIPQERGLGIEIGLAWGDWADLIAVYTDMGVSNGMKAEIDRWRNKGIPIEYRRLDKVEKESA